MIFLRRQILLNALKLLDLLVMVFSFALATAVVYYRFDLTSFEDFLSMRIKVRNFALFIGFLIVWHIIFSVFKLYHSRRLSTRWEEVFDIIKSTSAGTVVIFIASILFKISLATPIFILAFWAISSAVTILGRLVIRYALERLRLRGRNLRFVLIAGTNPRAIQFARKVEAKPDLGYRLIGFLDNEYAKNVDFQNSGYALAANFNSFPAFLRSNVVDEVVVCLPTKSLYDQASRIVALCEAGSAIRLANMVDGVILVIGAERVRWEAAQRASDRPRRICLGLC